MGSCCRRGSDRGGPGARLEGRGIEQIDRGCRKTFTPQERAHMEHRNISTAAIALLSGGLVLAGCSNWSSSPPVVGSAVSKQMNLASARAASPQDPTTFSQHLAVERSEEHTS